MMNDDCRGDGGVGDDEARGVGAYHTPSEDRRLPPRPKSEAEREWGRRVIGIRPIIGRPVIIIRPVVRTIAVTSVMPIATPRAEIGCLQRFRLLHRGLRGRRGGGIDGG